MKIILLGYNCSISFIMEKLKLKQESSLFEWQDSKNFQDVLYIIEKLTKGENINIEKRDYLKGNLFFENTEIHSMHYYNNPKLIDILSRRIDRFKNMIKSNEKIIFIREEHESYITEQNQIEKFKSLIETINKDCDYRILLLSKNANINAEKLYTFEKNDDMLLHYIYAITLDLYNIEFKTHLNKGDMEP